MIKAVLKAIWALTRFTIKATIWLTLICMAIGLVVVCPFFILAVPVIIAVIHDIRLMH